MRESPQRIPLDRPVDAFLADCRARRLSPRTLEHYGGSIASYRRWLGTPIDCQVLADIELERARAWAASLADRRSPASIGNAIAGLKVFTRWLVAEDHLRTDPLARLRKPRTVAPPIRPMDEDHVRALLGTMPRSMRALVIVLLDTGLRISEALDLRIDDVGPGFIRVRHGKGGRERLVPFGKVADATLRRYLSKERRVPVVSGSDRVFLNDRGGPLRPEVVRRAMRAAGRASGVDGIRVSPHTLRHTFARAFIVNGGGELALQQILGHRDLSMVRRYVALAGSDLAAIHAGASPMDRWSDLATRRGR